MMLKENNTLIELNLVKCKLQPEGLEEVIKGVQVNTMLKTLDLTFNNIDDKIASCLGKNDIIRCGISLYEKALHWYVPTGLELW